MVDIILLFVTEEYHSNLTTATTMFFFAWVSLSLCQLIILSVVRQTRHFCLQLLPPSELHQVHNDDERTVHRIIYMVDWFTMDCFAMILFIFLSMLPQLYLNGPYSNNEDTSHNHNRLGIFIRINNWIVDATCSNYHHHSDPRTRICSLPTSTQLFLFFYQQQQTGTIFQPPPCYFKMSLKDLAYTTSSHHQQPVELRHMFLCILSYFKLFY